MKTNSKSGFTIVELLAVVGILGILMGMVVYVAGGAVKQGRGNKADAIIVAIEQGINIYHNQEGEWPGAIERAADSESSAAENEVTLSKEEADEVVRELVKKSLEGGTGNAYLDCSMLFTGPKDAEGCNDNHSNKKNSKTYCGDKGCAYGLDFTVAYRGDEHHSPQAIDAMGFGYPGYEEGRFRRFKITYRRLTDTVKVEK